MEEYKKYVKIIQNCIEKALTFKQKTIPFQYKVVVF